MVFEVVIVIVVVVVITAVVVVAVVHTVKLVSPWDRQYLFVIAVIPL